MLNKKSKLEVEKENKENVNNLSNCNSNINMNLLNDSQNPLDIHNSKIKGENKKKVLILNGEKKAARQNLFVVKKNSDSRKDTNWQAKSLNANLNHNVNTKSQNQLECKNLQQDLFHHSDKNNSDSNSNSKDEIKNKDFNLEENQLDLVNSQKCGSNKNKSIDYLNRENSCLIKTYGSVSYQYIKHMEEILIEKNFLYKHKIDPEIRSKMVDWIIEVLAVYKSEAETFFLSVHIMDTFLSQCNISIKSEEVHLIGVTSMFIATKFEDIIPIRISSFVNKISHGAFSDKQIKIKERKILDVIGFERLITTSTYEFIRTYFFDFLFNNKKNLDKLNLMDVLEKFESASIYLAKVTLHFEAFYEYKHSLKAIACVIAAFDLIRTNKRICEEGEKFLREWIMFLIQESSYLADYIGDVYTKLVDCYSLFDKVPYISRNLTKYFPLSFLNKEN